MKTTVRVCLFLFLALGTTSVLEAQSFGSLRRILQRKYSPETHQDRLQAARDMSAHVDSKTLRFVIVRIRNASKNLSAAEESLAEIDTRIQFLQTKINKARRGGPGNVNQSNVSELAEKKEELKAKNRAVKEIREFVAALQETVGKLVAQFPEADQADALKTMIKAYKKSRDVNDKLVMLKILIGCDLPEVGLFLNKLVASKNELDRLRALIAAEAWGGKRAMRLALVCIEDTVWPVRAQAIRVLKKVGGKRAAEFLVACLEREDGRLKTDAITALRYLTGENFRKNRHLWKKWIDENGSLLGTPSETANAPTPDWADRGDEGARPVAGMRRRKKKAQPQGGGTGFYGVETTSKHVVYVLDFSGSMTFTGNHGKAGGSQDFGLIRLNGKRRIDRLAKELVRSVSSLPKKATFNVVVFTHNIRTWRKDMVYASKANKEALKAWIVTQKPDGTTNLFGGLEEAFKFAGRGSYDQSYDIAADTIFLLSDGSPSAGRLIKTEAILAEMRKINSLQRIAIHGISLGGGGGGLLQKLAAEHDGQFVEIPD